MRSSILSCVVLLALCSGALGDERIKICSQARVTMPSLKEHVAWLEQNSRYGHDTAEDFAKNAKTDDADYLQFQIYFLPEYPGGSGWFDFNGMTGITEAKQTVLRKWSCGNGNEPYPLLVMIGIEPKSIRNGTVYVSGRTGTFTIISLKPLGDIRQPLPMQLQNSGTVICPDVRTAEFDVDDRQCSNLAPFFR